MLISQLKVCQEWGSRRGTWRMLRVPDWRHGGQGYPWFHGWRFFTLKKIPWKFSVDIFIRSVSELGGQEGGYLKEVEGSWLETWRTGSPMMSCFFTLRMIPWKFCVDIYIRIVSGRGGQERGYLEDIEGFWRKTWRTWSFLMSWMMFFLPQGR